MAFFVKAIDTILFLQHQFAHQPLVIYNHFAKISAIAPVATIKGKLP
jgi:hypothetical protein